MDEMTKLRLATIIDCEGSIGIYHQKDGKLYHLKPIITVGQKDKKYLEQFKREFGFGRIAKSGPNMGYWEWTACYVQAYIVCVILFKYFQLKQENAIKIIGHYQKRVKSPTYHFNNKLAYYRGCRCIEDIETYQNLLTAKYISDQMNNGKNNGEKHERKNRL